MMIENDLSLLKRHERLARESADDCDDISDRVGHLERAHGYAERIAVLAAAGSGRG